MGFLNTDSMPRLVEKLADGDNIKITGNSKGSRVGTVIKKIVEKADDVTKAIEQEVVNDGYSFKVGTGDVDVSTDVQDGFGEVGVKGVTYQNLIQNDNNNEVIPNEIITTKKDTIQTFKINDGEINLNIDGKTYQDVFVNRPNSGANPDYIFKPDGVTLVLKGVNSNRHFNVKDKSSYMLKTGTYYTYVVNIIRNNNTEEVDLYFNTSYQNEISYFTATHIVNVPKGFTGTLKFLTETKTDFSSVTVADRSYLGTKGKTLDVDIKFNYYILEGNYTNIDLPTSIKGIESVAERETKNLLNVIKWRDGFIQSNGLISTSSDFPNAKYTDFIDIDINTLYYSNLTQDSTDRQNQIRIRCYDENNLGINDSQNFPSSFNDLYRLRANKDFANTKKIRIMILNSNVYTLPANPILVPNLYTEGDVNVKGTNSYMCVKKQINVKPNTTYVVKVNIESINKGDNNYTPRLQIKKGSTFICETMSSTTFNSGDNTTLDVAMYVNNAYASTTECEANFKNISITEANLYPVKLTNKSKNLLNISTFKPISYSSIQTSKNGNVITVKGLKTADVEAYTDAKAGNIKVYLEEDKTYSASFKSDGNFGVRNGEDTVEIFFMLDGTTKHYFNVAGQRTVTIPKGYGGYYYLRLDVNSGDKTHKFWDIQVEEGDTITDYEPYRNTISYDIDLPIPLRSLPNGAKDTIEDGKLIQRVNKTIMDGSDDENWVLNNGYLETGTRLNRNAKSNSSMISNYPVVNISYTQENKPYGTFITGEGKLRVVTVTTGNETDLSQAKARLQQNPLEVYYELVTPIEHDLNIPQIFEKYSTNIITTSNNIKPNFNIESKGYEYKALIKPSTQYTLMLNAKDGSDNLDFVLGGTKITVPTTNSKNLIQTPSTLTDSSLYIGGIDTIVNNVMLLEGNLTQDENVPSYFEGIVGVGDKSKNLLNPSLHDGLLDFGNYFMTNKSYGSCNEVTYSLKPNTSYTLSFKKYGEGNCWIGVVINGEYVNNNNYPSFSKTITTDSTGIITLKFGANTPSDTSSKIYDLQLRESNSVLNYEPYYDGYKIEILSCGKNLYKPNLQTKSANGLTFNLYGNTLTVNGTCTNTVDFRPVNGNHSETLELFNYVNKLPVGTTLVLSNNLGLKSFFGLIRNGVQIYPFETLTIEKGDYNIGCFVRFEAGQSYDNAELNIQLEINNIATKYESYKEDKTQILLDEPLMRLPNGVCDEITRDGRLIRRVGKMILNGSEKWSSNEVYGFVLLNAFTKNTNNNILCSHYALKKNATDKTDKTIFIDTNIAINDYISFPTLSEFKNYLAQQSTDGTPVTIYYELAEPIITEIPALYVRYFKDGYLTFNTLVAPESTHLVQLNKSAQIERSIREVQSLDDRVEKLESFYDDMILENSHKLQLLDMDFNYVRNMEDI